MKTTATYLLYAACFVVPSITYTIVYLWKSYRKAQQEEKKRAEELVKRIREDARKPVKQTSVWKE